ncbi:M24 family metallopeptidase [Longibacter salinarum]|uniref:M24 family metallopeptidase n=1 Tax=Longibacter salinarum TaxID=1850348 RepID=UPI001FE269E7|nr:aminopeptidase P family protein [Longibacter salinarum]
MPKVKRRLHDLEVDAVLVNFAPDVRWSSGFTGSNGLLVVTTDAAHLITDGRYRDQAENEVPDDVMVHISSNGLDAYLAESDLLAGCRRVAFQADHVTVSRRSDWDERFDGVEFVPVDQMLTNQAGVKSEDEVEAIAAAQRLTDGVFKDLLHLIQPGMTEKEVAAEIVYRHMKGGAEKMSFDPIVASGPNGALPHARPTDRVLQKGELVVIDMGCFLNGYASDMTRTIAIGAPDEEMKQAYAAVLEAQEAALQVARSGMQASELDAVARDVLASHDLADAFTHSLGHGLGLQIHEWPRVSRNSDSELSEGVVITIEPGVYIPGRFGIRIEDIVVIEEEGCRNLTTSPKDLKQIE